MVLRHVERAFALDASKVTWALFVTLAMRPVGRALFRVARGPFGRRPILMFNVAFFSVMELLSGLAPTWGCSWCCGRCSVSGWAASGDRFVAGDGIRPRPDARRAFGHLAAGISGGLPAGCPGVQVRVSAARLAGHVFHRLRAGFAGALHPASSWTNPRRGRRRTVPGRPPPGRRAGVSSRSGQALAGQWRLLLYLAVLMAAFNFFSHGTQEPVSQQTAGGTTRPLAGYGQQHRHRL